MIYYVIFFVIMVSASKINQINRQTFCQNLCRCVLQNHSKYQWTFATTAHTLNCWCRFDQKWINRWLSIWKQAFSKLTQPQSDNVNRKPNQNNANRIRHLTFKRDFVKKTVGKRSQPVMYNNVGKQQCNVSGQIQERVSVYMEISPLYDNSVTWKHSPHHWPIVMRIVDYPHKGN